MNLVSIIVPVYNDDKYVLECLRSIENQDYKNFEVIIVDDGSKDNSLAICKKFIYEIQSNRFKLFHKENGGLASARNFGLDLCSADSKFVIFVDSDDEISPICISSLIEHAYDQNMVTSPLTRCLKQNKKELKSNSSSNSYEYPWKNPDFLYDLKDGIINSCCGKCYSLNVIRKYNLRFENTLPEDTLFNIAYIDKINSICSLNSSFYYYYIWGQSMSTRPNERVFSNYIRIQKMLYDRVPSQCKNLVDKFVYPQYRINAMNFIRYNDFSLLGKYFSDESVKKAFQSYAPVSLGDRIIHFLLKHRLFKAIRHLVKD